jgi:hypothetical protein
MQTESPAQGAYALAHRDHSHAAGLLRLGSRLACIKADAIVFDTEDYSPLGSGQGDLYDLGLRMFRNIVQGFLGDSEKSLFEVG